MAQNTRFGFPLIPHSCCTIFRHAQDGQVLEKRTHPPAPCLNSNPSRLEYMESAFLNAATFFCLTLSPFLASVV